MNVSIIVVNYNGGSGVVRNVRSVLQSVGTAGFELVVVDNASTDGSVDAVRTGIPEAILVEAPANAGYAAGVNLGLGRAGGDVFVIMNADVAPRGEAVARLARTAAATGALSGGAVLDGSGRISSNCFRRLPVLRDIMREALFLSPRTRLEADAALPEGVHRTDVVSGSVMALSRETLAALGPMDEEYFLYNEDVEWCRRARARGVGVCVDRGAQFSHEGGASTRASEGPAFAARVLSDFQYFCEGEKVDPAAVRRLWKRRLWVRALLYRCLAALDPGRTEAWRSKRRRAAACSILSDALDRFVWSRSDDRANAHPSRLFRFPEPPPPDERPTIVELVPNMEYGGAQRLVERLVTGPLSRHFRFVVVCLTHRGEIGESLARRGVPVHLVGMTGWRSWREWLRTADYAALVDCDVVHSHLLPADIAARLGFAGLVPRISTKHSVDVWMRAHHRVVESWALRGAADVLAVSDETSCAKSHLGAVGMLPPVVPAPSTVPRAPSPEPLFPPGRPGRLAIVGRLHPVKRVDLFLRAAAVLEREAPGEFEFRVVGEGREEAALRDLAERLGIAGRVDFRGAVEDVARELDEVDVVFMVSDHEGRALSLLETVARGRVPIVRNAPGSGSSLPSSLSCCIVRSADPEDLARAALDVRARSSFYTERVAAAAGAGATEESYARAHECVYRRALGRRARPRRVRVLHLITRLIVGGAQENTIASVDRVDNDRYDSELWCGPQTGAEGSLIEDARLRGVVVRILPDLVREVDPWKDAAVTLTLVRLMSRRHFDVVHTHSSKAGIVGRIAARLARVPHVVHTVHGWGFHEHMSGALKAFYVMLERIMERWTRPLVSVSERTTSVGLGERIGNRESYVLIRSGIPLARFHPDGDRSLATRRELGVGRNEVVVGSIGRLSAQKNPFDFLKVARSLLERRPDLRFLYVGDGPLRADIEREIEAAGIEERILLLGIRSDVPDLLRAMDVFILTSLWEGLPRVVPQALATGVPVVSYNVAGIEEAVVDGVNGHLVDPGDVETMVERLRSLIGDASKRGDMSRRAVLDFDRSFSEDVMISDLESLYATLTDRASGAKRAL
jgi:glycosyltransferase involved in cell wall biosynthesis/GT2 family glycosyltransferase